MLKDRFTRGALAGLAGGIAMNLFSLVSFLLNFTETTFIEWATIVILGRPEIQGLGQYLLGLVGHLLFTVSLGILFTYLLPVISSRVYLFKGLLYGMVAWFAIYALSLLYRVAGIFPLELKTATSNLVGAAIYGLVLAWSLAWLDSRSKLS